MSDRNYRYIYGGAVVTGAVAVVAALLYVNTRKAAPYLPVPPAMKACRVSSQCALVETRCDRCCGYDAIALGHLAAYEAMYREACAPYELKLDVPAQRAGEAAPVTVPGKTPTPRASAESASLQRRQRHFRQAPRFYAIMKDDCNIMR